MAASPRGDELELLPPEGPATRSKPSRGRGRGRGTRRIQAGSAPPPAGAEGEGNDDDDVAGIDDAEPEPRQVEPRRGRPRRAARRSYRDKSPTPEPKPKKKTKKKREREKEKEKEKEKRIGQEFATEVVAADGTIYKVGEFTKKKIFDKDGAPLSKSCHQCQYQHIAWICRNGDRDCVSSVCTKCLNAWYPGRTLEEFREKCGRCRGICNCRACLRKEHNYKPPEFSDEQLLEFSKHILQVTGPHVKEYMQSQDAEAQSNGVQVDEIFADHAEHGRLTCDECATSIPNMYRTCEACGVDICTECAQALRRENGECHCPKCGQLMELKAIMTKPVIQTLQSVAKEYGTQREERGFWKWLNPSTRNNKRKAPDLEPSDGTLLGPAEGSEPQALVNPNVPGFTGEVPSYFTLASQRPDGRQNYIFSPNAEDFKMDSPHRAAMVRQFQACMNAGEPVLVRDLKARMNWLPECMLRACVEKGNKGSKTEAKPPDVMVIDCLQDWGEQTISQYNFFKIYKSEGNHGMLKVKDWPPEENFRDRLQRHNQDFLEMLPMPEYMHPRCGPLNSHKYLPERCCPPDLGPKTYVALGRVGEHEGEGDSVTKLHVDMGDAFNVLCHAQYLRNEEQNIHVRKGAEEWNKPTYGNAGAVWDIIRREDSDIVRDYLRGKGDAVLHHGLPISEHKMTDPISDQMFMLTEKDRQELQKKHGVHVWHFEQHVWEGLYIPVGCPHQVRNLRPCLKTAVDFVASESFPIIEKVRLQNRKIGMMEKDTEDDPTARNGADKLQGTAMMLYSAIEAYSVLQHSARREEEKGKESMEDVEYGTVLSSGAEHEDAPMPKRSKTSNESQKQNDEGPSRA